MIGIVTDSLSCLTEAECAEFNVELARVKCVIDSATHADTTAPVALPLNNAYTVAPTSADYYKLFSAMSLKYSDILCITSSSKISMSHANACIAARATSADRITVIDSGATAGAIYLLIRMCRELEESGAGFGDIVRIISNQKRNLRMSFSVKDFQFLEKAGKYLSLSAHTPAPIMNQRSVCAFEKDGKLKVLETAAGALNEMRALAAEHSSPRRIVVHYSSSDMRLYELTSMLRRRFPDAEIIRRRLSLSILINTGEDIIGVFSYGMGENT